MKKYDTVIFDLDGTLLDTLYDLRDSTNFALSFFGFPERSTDEIRAFVGNGIGNLIEKALGAGKEHPDYDKVFNKFKEHYAENCNNLTCAYNGVDELLAYLKEKGIKLAVVSNKVDFAVKELCKRYFNGIIDIAIGETEKIRRKPYPDEVEAALTLLGSKKENSLYIGDSEVDILTGKNTDIDVLAVTWGFRSKDALISAGAKFIADDTEEVKAFIFGK